MKKFSIVVILVVAVFAQTQVLAADPFGCYECNGEECNGNAKVTVCSAETVATPRPTELPTASSTVTPATTATTSQSTSKNLTRAESEFVCYTVSYNIGTKTLRKKGCVENSLNACNIAIDGVTDPLEACIICRESKCNSSAAIKLSVASAVLVFFFMLFK